MKFRQLSLNPFHNSRGKLKKSSRKFEQLLSKDRYENNRRDQYDLGFIVMSPRNEFVHVKDKDLIDLDLCRQANNFEAFDQDNIDFNSDIKTKCRLDNYFYDSENEQNLEQIDNLVKDKCFSNLSSGCLHCETLEKNEKYCHIISTDAERANSGISPFPNNVPKVRSRIKTNPWLPSPKLRSEMEKGRSPVDTPSSTDSNPSDTESDENDINSSSDDNCVYGGHNNDFFNLCPDERKWNSRIYKGQRTLLLQARQMYLDKIYHLTSNLMKDFADEST